MLWLRMLLVVRVLLLVILVAAVSAILTCQLIAATSQEASVTVMSAAINMETAVLISIIFNAVSVSDEPI